MIKRKDKNANLQEMYGAICNLGFRRYLQSCTKAEYTNNTGNTRYTMTATTGQEKNSDTNRVKQTRLTIGASRPNRKLYTPSRGLKTPNLNSAKRLRSPNHFNAVNPKELNPKEHLVTELGAKWGLVGHHDINLKRV